MRMHPQGFVLPALGLALLELWARTVGRHSEALAAPSAAALAWLASLSDGSLWEASAFTLGSAVLGLALAAGIGVPLGAWLGLSPTAARLGFISIEAVRPVPSVALIPLAMLVFGFGLSMQVSVVAFACVWPMLLQTQAAVRQIEPHWLSVSHALGFGPWRRFASIIVPAIVPRLFTALRLSMAVALVVAVTVELAANPHGMGYAMLIAQQTLAPAGMLGWLIWIGLVGMGLNAATLALQRAVERRMRIAAP